jgi:hypothetical protein
MTQPCFHSREVLANLTDRVIFFSWAPGLEPIASHAIFNVQQLHIPIHGCGS